MLPEEVYKHLPNINCKGLCYQACSYIGAMPIEHQRMYLSSGKPLLFHSETGRCGYLTSENRCEVYEDRPLMCRAFGTTPVLKCPFGCEPDRWMSDEEAARHFQALGGEGDMAAVVP